MRTLKEIAQEAIDVQNASNLRGIVRSFAQVVEELYTDHKIINQHHPIILLWVSKIHSLAGMGLSDTVKYHHAHYQCQNIAAFSPN